MLLLGNVGQQLDIGDLNNAIAGMQNAFVNNRDLDREQGRAIQQLQQENQELKLYLATLLRLLVARGVLRADEVKNRGPRNRKVKRKVKSCLTQEWR
jgi:cell shape-determining protein MreC